MSSSSENAKKIGLRMEKICEANPNFINLEKRLEHLDKCNIDSQVTMVHNTIEPNMITLQREEEFKLCKIINNDVSDLARSSKGRIHGIGTIPFDSLEDGGLEEMDRAVHDLGLKGFMVLTNIHGKSIDHFSSFWERVAKLGVVVYLHPSDPVSAQGRPYEDEYDLMHVFGWPFETTLALSRIVFSGILDKFPNLRLISHHLGGMIPFFFGRIAESYDRRSSFVKVSQVEAAQKSTSMTELFKKFYYDTAVGGNKHAVRLGYEIFGAERLVFSTDYPWGPEGGQVRLRTYPKAVQELGLSKEEQENILGANIRRILRVN
ncbi:MAG: amidohydrolase [Nitrososphaerota archaeon]|nr:amidohydrolase [Nitrososphaerota archaeon]